jgi:hypothetical protein
MAAQNLSDLETRPARSRLGFAAIGTLLCPSELLISVPNIRSCTVIAIGMDHVSVLTGLGPVQWTFDVVINAPGNGAAHVPDLPVISGTFGGNVDLSNAVLLHVPLGSITGNFAITKVADLSGQLVTLPAPVTVPFTGTFRLPFGVDTLGKAVRHEHTPTAQHFYLADDGITLIRVKLSERSIGFPTVRLEVRFSQ